jgi:hypothetical protein
MLAVRGLQEQLMVAYHCLRVTGSFRGQASSGRGLVFEQHCCTVAIVPDNYELLIW